MRSSLPESPLNPLPPVIWLLTLPVIASEAVFALGGAGLIGGAEGVGAPARRQRASSAC